MSSCLRWALYTQGMHPHMAYLWRDRREVEELSTPEGLSCLKTPTWTWWYVRTIDDQQIILAEMLPNWRIITTMSDNEYFLTGGWCYRGKSFASFCKALTAAYAFDPHRDRKPAGFFKEAWSFRG